MKKDLDPKMQPARAPPQPECGEECQIDPAADAWDGRDDHPAGNWI